MSQENRNSDYHKSMFPPLETADEDGILCFSKSITTNMLIDAYQHGIFPWPFDANYPVIPWSSPAMRGILPVSEVHIPHGLRRELSKYPFDFHVNANFKGVMEACANATRPDQDGTWITPVIIDAYQKFHELGYAHSFEAYSKEGELVGGLYGVSVGKIFCGESMFYKISGASKFAFVNMVKYLEKLGVVLLDTQVVTSATAAFGAREIPRETYISLLSQFGGPPLVFPPI